MTPAAVSTIMIRSALLSTAALILVAGLALAEPGVEVRYYAGVPQIQLEGSYPQSRYTVYRAERPDGPFAALTELGTLCVGTCYAEDPAALPGRTYYYRFDLQLQDGSLVTYGPFAVTISPDLAARVQARMIPNPSRAASRIELILAGSASDASLDVDVRLFDLQGRAVRTILRGPLARGMTSFVFDGRADDGRPLPSGTYFLRFSTPLGTQVARIVRAR